MDGRDRVRPFPSMPVEEKLESADPLRLSCTDDQINRAMSPRHITGERPDHQTRLTVNYRPRSVPFDGLSIDATYHCAFPRSLPNGDHINVGRAARNYQCDRA